jgi:hypothetical protein
MPSITTEEIVAEMNRISKELDQNLDKVAGEEARKHAQTIQWLAIGVLFEKAMKSIEPEGAREQFRFIVNDVIARAKPATLN